jgi:hypothetical protein
MKQISILLTLILTISSASAKKPPLRMRAFSVKEAQVIDATHLRRNSKDEIEVIVVQQAAGLLTLHLNRRENREAGTRRLGPPLSDAWSLPIWRDSFVEFGPCRLLGDVCRCLAKYAASLSNLSKRRFHQ